MGLVLDFVILVGCWVVLSGVWLLFAGVGGVTMF